MKSLVDWYAGDEVVFAGFEVLRIITVIVALAWAAERLWARRRAALRGGLWFSALAGVLLTPAFVLLGRQLPWHIALFALEAPASPRSEKGPSNAVQATPAVLPSAPINGGAAERTRFSETSGSREATPSFSHSSSGYPPLERLTSDSALPRVIPEEPAADDDDSPLAHWNPLRAIAGLALLIWGLGSYFLGIRLVHGWWHLRWLRRGMRQLDSERWMEELMVVAGALSLRRLPPLYLSPDVRSPLVAGLFNPCVVLPERLSEHSEPHQMRAVLVHECAHVLRRDPWVHLLQRLALVLFWVHPLVHLLNRRLDRAREEVCDNHVLAQTDAPAYAETLLTVAQLCYPDPRMKGYLTMLPRHYNLEHRIADLLEERRDTATRLPILQRVVLLTSLVLLLLTVSSVGLHGTAKARDEKAEAASTPQGPPKGQAPAANALRGTVLAADGSPAADAIIWAAKITHGPLERQETVADAKGRYTLNLAPGKWYVWARHGTQGGEGRPANRSVEILPERVPEPITIRLAERGKFRGRLLEAETGKPIANGRLFLDAGLILAAGADGRFEVGGLARKDHEAWCVC